MFKVICITASPEFLTGKAKKVVASSKTERGARISACAWSKNERNTAFYVQGPDGYLLHKYIGGTHFFTDTGER